MIRRHIIGFNDSDSGGPRWGSCVIFSDGTETVVIDGYTGAGKTKLIKRHDLEMKLANARNEEERQMYMRMMEAM